MAYELGGIVGHFVVCVLVAYVFIGVARLMKRAARGQLISAIVGVIAVSTVTLARGDITTWVAAALAIAFLYWRFRSWVKPAVAPAASQK